MQERKQIRGLPEVTQVQERIGSGRSRAGQGVSQGGHGQSLTTHQESWLEPANQHPHRLPATLFTTGSARDLLSMEERRTRLPKGSEARNPTRKGAEVGKGRQWEAGRQGNPEKRALCNQRDGPTALGGNHRKHLQPQQIC